MSKASLHAAAAVLATLVATGAGAATLAPISVTTDPGIFPPDATFTIGNVALGLDGNVATGFDITATRPSGASGFSATFAYDVSGFSTVSGFNFAVTFMPDVGPIDGFFNSYRLGVQCCAQFISGLFTNGVLTTASVSPTSGGSGVDNLAFYRDGDMLRVVLTTGLSSTDTTTPITFNIREVTMDVTGTLRPTVIPVPAALPLLVTGLGLLGFLARRRRAVG
jgi:hypothetical protein